MLALLLSTILLPIGFIYSSFKLWYKVKFKTWFKKLEEYLFVVAISIDQLGNVVCQELFNDLLITKEGIKFGDLDLTISTILGLNEKKGTLSCLGMYLVQILNLLDPGHTKNSKE